MRALLGFAAVALVVSPHLAKAQASLRGVVRADSARPLPLVEVSIEALGRITRTDSTGAYSFADLAPGLRAVRFRFPGYQPLSVVVQLSNGQTLNKDIVLQRMPVVLDTTRTLAERRRMAWFEDHRRIGLGHFLTQEDLQKQHVINLGQAMSSLANAKVRRGTGNFAWIMSNRPRPRVIRPDAFDMKLGALPGCYSRVYLDGVPVYNGRDGESLFDINQVPVDDVTGVEYYSGPETPVEYSSADMDCGVLVIWTRR